MAFQIDLGQWNSVFAVPSALVDQHIKLASEAQIKVILYILRRSGESIATDDLTKALGISKEEAQNAVNFWIERGLIADSGAKLTPPAAQADPAAPLPQADVSQPNKPQKHTAMSRAQR